MKKKLKLGFFIFLTGFIGILSILTMDVPLPEEIKKKVLELFTVNEFKLLTLINPTIFLLISVIIGVLLYDKVNFKLPIIEKYIYKNDKKIEILHIVKYGIIGGVISGMLTVWITVLFIPILPAEFIEFSNKFKPNIITKFLYGGITEEILIRFGVMTSIVWILYKIIKNKSTIIYWAGIVISAILFGFAHLPIVYGLAGMPTTEVMLYVILGNTIGGIIFGWLYWQKGLETSMIAHVFTHAILLVG